MPHRLALLLLVLLVAGCRNDTPWDLSDAAWDRALRQADRHAAEARTLVQPGQGQAPSVEPGQPLALSVEQAVIMALTHNRDLAVQQLQPQIAQTFAQIESAVFDPRLFTEANFLKARTSEVSRATGATFGTEREARDIRVGVAERLPTGTDLQLDVSTARDFSDRTPDQHESRVGLTLTQALLRGFSPAANLVSVRQARLEEVASEYELRGFTEMLVADVESAYWEAVLARQEIAIVERALEVGNQFVEETRQRIAVGVLPQAEVYVAEAEIAQRRQDLIDTRSREQAARLRLLRLIHPNEPNIWTQPLDLVSAPELPPPGTQSASEHMTLARMYRPDVNEARVRLEQDRLEVIRTRNGLLPVLDLFLTLGKTGFADSFGRSVDAMNDSTYDLSAGLRFEYPLGNRGAEALHQQALLLRQQSAEAVGNLVELAELDVQLALVELERARQQVDAAAATVRLREQSLQNEVERQRVGRGTNLLVAQAGRDLLESRLAQASAIIQVKLALIDLYRLDGTLLRRRGVQAPGDQPRP